MRTSSMRPLVASIWSRLAARSLNFTAAQLSEAGSAGTLPAMALGLNGPPNRRHFGLNAVLLFGGAAIGVIALHLATNSTLGFHTDELYYLDAGSHPAFG